MRGRMCVWVGLWLALAKGVGVWVMPTEKGSGYLDVCGSNLWVVWVGWLFSTRVHTSFAAASAAKDFSLAELRVIGCVRLVACDWLRVIGCV